jgi:hypothetical protein
MNDDTYVLSHPLPQVLVAAVTEGRWTAPNDVRTLHSAFGEPPAHAEFYNFVGMASETSNLLRMDPEYRASYIGVNNGKMYPGDINLECCVLIGDIGPERPFALDYRRNYGDPEVVLLAGAGWRLVAPNVSELIHSLGLDELF